MEVDKIQRESEGFAMPGQDIFIFDLHILNKHFIKFTFIFFLNLNPVPVNDYLLCCLYCLYCH